jgi:putative flippase GtrA
MTPLIAPMLEPDALPPPIRQQLRVIGREGWRYAVTSAAALAADTAAYVLAYQAGLPLTLAVALGFALGLTVAYAGSVLWVFDQHRLRDRRAEFAAFASIGLLGLLLTQASLWWLVSQHHWPAVPAKLLTAAGVFAFNFTLRKLLLFSRPAT